MKITSLDRTVEDLFKQLLFVPRFQRPYDWEKEHVEQFWSDTIVENDKDYFIGSVVLYRTHESFGIVDGQQRITTLLMILCALRNEFDRKGLTELAEAIQTRIERVDLDNKRVFVLHTETSNPFLQDTVLKRGESTLAHKIGSEEERLQQAFKVIQDKMRHASEAPVPTGVRGNRSEHHLKTIRNRIFGLKLITVELDNEDDAYLVFETLNKRGKDLQVSHLLKNHLSRLLRPKNKHVDDFKIRWSHVLNTLEESQIDIDVDDFLHHQWLSTSPKYVTKEKLYPAARKGIDSDTRALSFLKELEADASLYRTMVEPAFRKWKKEERSLVDRLGALAIFRVKQPFPLVLSILRAYSKGEMTLKNADKLLQAVERFHFSFTAVASRSSSGGLSFMYASWAREIYCAGTGAKMQAICKKVVVELSKRHPAREDFIAGFAALAYSDENTKQKKLVQYVLRNMADGASGTKVLLDHSMMTIEHVAPQNPRAGVEPTISPEHVAMIGNLLWCSDDMQDRLKNKSFGEKRKILREKGIVGADGIVGLKEWTNETIVERSKAMAADAYDRVWRLKRPDGIQKSD